MNRFPLVSFNAGELSPQVDARSDVDKYRAGCRTLENMIPRIYGTAERRPGTKYIDTCNGVARDIPFIYSNTISYICLLEDQKMYFYYDGGRVLDSDGRRLSIDTPYLAADLFQIQYKQSNDVMWLVHPDYAPRKLSRTSANSFSLDIIPLNDGPFQKRHDLAFDDGMTMTPSATFSVATDDISDEATAYFASHSESTTFGAAKAFDDRLTGAGCYWQSSTGNFQNEYVGCQFSSGKTIKQVRIAPFAVKPSLTWLPDYFSNPRYIKIDASNDGTSWTNIPINGWSGNCQSYNGDEAELGKITNTGEWVSLTLDNTTAYSYWRVFVRDVWGGEDSGVPNILWVLLRTLKINEIEFIESTTTWGDDLTLTSSSPFFDATHVGALFSLTQPRTDTLLSGSMTYPTTGTTDDILVEGGFTFSTHGTWTGTIALERSVDRTVWETYRKWISDADMNVQYTGTEEEANVYYRINVSALEKNTASGTTKMTSKVKYDLSVNSSTQTGIVRVTGYVSSTVVNVEVVKPLASTDATERWAEGSWSDYRGWPRTMTFFESRAVYAGTPHQPQTVWLSGTDDFEHFYACTKDDSPFSITMSSDTRNAIQWISSLESILIGTSGGEWRLKSAAYDEPLTPTNFSLKQQTSYGSKAIQALPVNDAILFVDFVGRRVREASYSGNKDKYIATDLTALAEHITESGITSIAFQKNPDPILWCTRSDGTLLSMTYEREQDVVAWSRHPFETGLTDSEYASSGSSSAAGWSEVFPTGEAGPYWSTVAISGDGTTMMAGAYYYDPDTADLSYPSWGGRLYISEDSGTTWTEVQPGGDVPQTWSEIKINEDGSVILACAEAGRTSKTTGGAWLSTDGGSTWTDIDPNGVLYESYWSRAAMSDDGKYIILAPNFRTSGKIELSTDYGATWTTNILDVDLWYVKGEAVAVSSTGQYMSSTDTVSYWWSTDYGTTWNRNDSLLSNGESVKTHIAYGTDLTVIASDADRGIFKSTDYGVTWGSKEEPGVTSPDYAWYQHISMSRDGQIVLLGVTPGTAAHGVLLSEDGGDTWAWDYPTTDGTRWVDGTGNSAVPLWWRVATSDDGEILMALDSGQPSSYADELKPNLQGRIFIKAAVTTTYDSALAGRGVTSIGAIPGSTEDEIWLVVLRYIDGEAVYYLEQMQPRSVDDQEDQWFVDSGLALETADADGIVSGLDHLEGEEVAVLVDGGVAARQTVSGGQVNVGQAIVGKCIVGLPFRYILQPMRFDLQVSGTTKGTLKRFAEAVISFYESGNVQYGTDEDNLFEMDWRGVEAYGTPPALYTGDKVVAHEGGFSVEDPFILTGDDPVPCTVRAIIPRLDVTGR